MVGVHPGEAEQPLPGLVVLGEGRPELAAGARHVEDPLPLPVGVDLGSIGLQPDRAASPIHRPRVASQPAR